MLSKAGWWGVSIAVMASATLAIAPSNAIGQTAYATQDENIADAAYCPASMWFRFTSYRTGTQRIYLGPARRGADAALGRVYYYFSSVFELNGTYEITGNFWVLGLECRMGALGSAIIDFTNSFRIEYAEFNSSTTDLASGGACTSRDETSSPDYDPYNDSEEAPVNGGPQCGGGDATGDSSDPGQPPPAPAGTSCSQEYLVIEVSNDGGLTWEVWWQGEGYVCQ
jgi:hypothetical protein